MARTKRSDDVDVWGARAVGERLRLTREALGYTQAFMAIQCKMSPQAWNNNERGADRLGLNSALRLVQAFAHHGVDLNWIYNGRLDGIAPDLQEKIVRLRAGSQANPKIGDRSRRQFSPETRATADP